jgi:aldehyde dehydrogenase (NAD+)
MEHIKKLQTKLFINNEFVDAVSGKTFPTLNPATEEVITQVAEADAADIDKAVAAARKAFASWRLTEGSVRRDLLLKLTDLMTEHADELAALETLDNGKPFAEAQGDIGFSVKVLRYYAGWADKIYGKVCPGEGNHFTFTKHQPIGVCGQIVPWNYPIMMASWKIGPALATGNCVVLKPAEQTPLSSLRLAELIRDAGFPAGVVNIVPGFGATAGAALARHPHVDKIAFTGSTAVGRQIQIMAAESNLKRVSLELGGKSPMIVLDDADLDNAVNSALVGVFLNQGQVCTASSRIFVQEGVYDKFVEAIRKVSDGRKQGEGFEADVLQGPLISERQLHTVTKYIESAKTQGARLVLGGTRLDRKGYFVPPTIFADVTDDMTIAKEEIFGPVMSVLKFKTIDEAIERANATAYGLAAAVHTTDMGNAFKFLNEIEAGTVWVNTWDTCDASAPFGGFKQSGHGRELGEYALEHYSEVKTVMWAIPNPPVRN